MYVREKLKIYIDGWTTKQKEELAKDVGIGLSYLYMIVRGMRNASPRLANKFEKRTGIDRNEFISERNKGTWD